MAHYAELDQNNVVLQVVVVANEDIGDLPFPDSEPVGIAFLDRLIPNRRWAQTSFNGNFRFRFAGIGSVYYPPLGFGNQKPYDNWVFDESQCLWVPPVAKPDDGKAYEWDQNQTAWVLSRVQPPAPVTTIG